MSRLGFKLEAEASGSRARATTFQTLHSKVETPIFMPVGTQATVRGHSPDSLEALGFKILLANTYHLMLRPGAEVFRKMGGIQKFMNWKGSVLTDSGGFQIFSLPNDRVMTEEGALFKSYTTQQKVLLTPELSIETQKAIGSDIMMVLDQCVPSTVEFAEAEKAMHLTHRWAQRSYEARGDSPQSLFGIIQGACFPALRKISADFLTQLPFDGFAIGGLAVGEGKNLRDEMTEVTTDLMPRHLPRYLMGVGTPSDLLEAVHRGVDMFDCIMPTAMGQQGVAFTSRGRLDTRRGAYKFADISLDPECKCPTCTEYSLSYLHHLVRTKETLGKYLLSSHNLYFYAQLMREMRQSIFEDKFLSLYHQKKENFAIGDTDFPITRPKVKKKKTVIRELGDYKLHETSPGQFTICHIPSREVMHPVADPMEEARTLYVGQSRLQEKLKDTTEAELVIWDVGLGSAMNAMAAINAYEEACIEQEKPLRPVRIVSFENDLNSLKLALKHPQSFKHLRHSGPATVVEKHHWNSKLGPLLWDLLEGDFLDNLWKAPTPDIIFFDPFSLNTNSTVWTLECFKKIFEICGHHPAELFTYSGSTAVRAMLLGAGFFVAKGPPSGNRKETTIALTPAAALLNESHIQLTQNWLQQWERSSAKFPQTLEVTEHPEFESRIRSHPQFSCL